MKRIMKKYCSVIVSLVMLVTCMTGFFSGMEATASDTSTVTKEDGVKYIRYEDINTYRSAKDEKGYYTKSPELSGYVFGGWFAESDETSSIGDATSGSAWAKFVPQETLTIKAQISIAEPTSGASFSDLLTSVQKVNLRLVTGVDSLKYRKVIFQVAHLNKTVEQEMTSVMSRIDIKTGEDSTYESKEARDIFGNAAEYFATLRFTGIATANDRYLKDWAITPMLVTQDGTLVKGITREGLKITDANRFLVDRKNVTMTADTTRGKVTASLGTNTGDNVLYFKTNTGISNSASWEITGTLEQLSTIYKGFVIQNSGKTMAGFYIMSDSGLTYRSSGGNVLTLSSNEHLYVFDNANKLFTTDNPKNFKAVIQNNVFSFLVENKLVWQLPLATYGGFDEGTSYYFGLYCKNPYNVENGQAEWSDLMVKAGTAVEGYRFLVDSKNATMTADTVNGKVAANLNNAGDNVLYFRTNTGTSSSTSWEITGQFKQFAKLWKGFTIKNTEGTQEVYYMMSPTGLTYRPTTSGSGTAIPSTGNSYVFANADLLFDNDDNPKSFKAVIQNNVFSLLVEDKLVWQLPLQDVGGFATGTSYQIGLYCKTNGGQAEWSDLTIKAGTDVEGYRFLVDSKNATMTADTVNGKVTADLTDANVSHLWFKTDNASSSSQSWEVTGTLEKLANIELGFTIQKWDKTKVGFFTMCQEGMSYNKSEGTYPEEGWKTLKAGVRDVFANEDYVELLKNTDVKKTFRAVIKDDIFSFLVEDKLVWQIPLERTGVGGFTADDYYRFGIRCQGQGGQAEWSSLTVKYGDAVGGYKFLVGAKNNEMTVDTLNGKVTANLAQTDTAQKDMWFAADNQNGTLSEYSTQWKITGNLKQLTTVNLGFSIQAGDGARYYTMSPEGLVYRRGNGQGVLYDANSTYVTLHEAYKELLENVNTEKTFEASIQNDTFTFKVDNQTVWQLSLIDANFGGFTEGTSYRFSLRCQGAGGQAEWSNLTVKYGEQVQ